MKRIITMLATWVLLVSMGATSALFAQNSKKNLIVYFSLYGNQKSVLTDVDTSASRTLYNGNVRGNTETIAQMIQDEVGGDIVLIETENKFSNGYNAVLEEGKHTKNTKFKATKTNIDLSKYDSVFIGFPAWWYDMPDPLFDFLDKHDLSGKNVYVFATSGGSGLMRSISEIQKLEPKANVNKNGFHVYYTSVASAKGDVVKWLKNVGAK
ncbi:MAG: NAD(P)H-dependent oxidoreductase [Treponema sp.]|nr:NAD(P)H-dependent oxidoreductase [Treponema sp.]